MFVLYQDGEGFQALPGSVPEEQEKQVPPFGAPCLQLPLSGSSFLRV